MVPSYHPVIRLTRTASSQLPIRGFDNLRVHNLLIQVDYLYLSIWHRLRALPAQRCQSLCQDGVAIMIACIHPICIHGAQVLHLKLDQTPGQFFLIPKVCCEDVGFKFELARQDIHEQFDYCVHWRKRVGEQDETNYDGMRVAEAERGVERVVVDKDAEEREDVEHVELELVKPLDQKRGAREPT